MADPIPRGASEYPSRFQRTAWGAIFAGALVALVVQLALSLLGVSVGLAVIDPVREGGSAFAGIGIGGGIWYVLSALVALFLGGWVTGNLGGVTRRMDAMLHGVVMWCVVTLTMFYMMTSATGRIISGTTALIGDALNALGGGISAVAEGESDAAQPPQEPGQIGFNVTVERAKLFLRQSGDPALQQQNLEGPTTSPGETASPAATTASRNAFEELSQALARTAQSAGATAGQNRRQDAISLIVANTGKSREEADRIVNDWMQAYQNPLQQARVLAGGEAFQGTAQSVADQAFGALSAAAAWAFVAMVIGFAAAAFGGATAVPSERTTRTSAP